MRLAIVFTVLLFPALASAQTNNYHIDWFLQGANAPFQQHNQMGTEQACVDDPTPPPVPNNVVNPSSIFLQHDSDDDGDLDGCTFLFANLVNPLGVGDYFGRAHVHRVADPALVSGGSADSNPFAVVGVPADPAVLVIR